MCSRTVHARRVAASSWRPGRDSLQLRVGYQFAVAHRLVGDGEFEYLVEDHASAARAASVEPEDELVEVALQVRLVDRTLMRAQQPPLDQRRRAVDSGEQLTGVLSAGASGPLAARLIGVAELVDTAVAGPAVGDHSRARLDVLGDEGVQRGGRPIGQDGYPGSPEPARFLNPDLSSLGR